MGKPFETIKGTNYTVGQAGPWSGMLSHAMQHPLVGEVPGKLFLRDALGLTGMEVSLGVLPPGTAVPFLHRHREHEELYIFVSGRGQFLADGDVIDVREGTVIRVAPAAARSWRNNSTEPLHYIVVQAKEGTLSAGTIEDGAPVPGKPVWPE